MISFKYSYKWKYLTLLAAEQCFFPNLASNSLKYYTEKGFYSSLGIYLKGFFKFHSTYTSPLYTLTLQNTSPHRIKNSNKYSNDYFNANANGSAAFQTLILFLYDGAVIKDFITFPLRQYRKWKNKNTHTILVLLM